MLDNGQCIVEIILKDNVAEAEASYYDIASSARELLRSCAMERREGGIATDIGQSPHIRILFWHILKTFGAFQGVLTTCEYY